MFMKNIGCFCKQNSKKGANKCIQILERRYFIDFERSACETGIYIWKQVITKSNQTSVYKWQYECEYPSSPNSAMTLMTLIFLLSDRSNLDWLQAYVRRWIKGKKQRISC